MKKSELTKIKIIKESSILFNMQGYKNTSISDITNATGYTKGAIYRHFDSKEDLENKSFEFLSTNVLDILSSKIKKQKNVFDKLGILFTFFNTYVNHPIIKGGCPLLNVAIEVDESNSILRKKALLLLENLKSSINHILENGVKHQQLKPEINTKKVSVIIISSLEGAIMTSRLKRSNEDLNIVTNHLMNYIEQYKY